MVWHPKMDEYMDSLDGYLFDEISQRLITLVANLYSTFDRILQHSEIEEEVESSGNVKKAWVSPDILSLPHHSFPKALDMDRCEEGDDVTNDILVSAKLTFEKQSGCLRQN